MNTTNVTLFLAMTKDKNMANIYVSLVLTASVMRAWECEGECKSSWLC